MNQAASPYPQVFSLDLPLTFLSCSCLTESNYYGRNNSVEKSRICGALKSSQRKFCTGSTVRTLSAPGFHRRCSQRFLLN